MSRYKPSDMTEALGLKACDFRHGDSDDVSHDSHSTDGSGGGADGGGDSRILIFSWTIIGVAVASILVVLLFLLIIP